MVEGMCDEFARVQRKAIARLAGPIVTAADVEQLNLLDVARLDVAQRHFDAVAADVLIHLGDDAALARTGICRLFAHLEHSAIDCVIRPVDKFRGARIGRQRKGINGVDGFVPFIFKLLVDLGLGEQAVNFDGHMRHAIAQK